MRGGRSSRRHCRCRSPSAPRGVPDRFQLVYSRRTRLIPITPRNSLIPTRPVPALLWVDDTDDKSIASAAGPLRLRSTCSYRHARSAGLSQRTPRPRPAERDACNPLCIPKEVLHTRTRERLLEHFLSVVLRPGRMPPLTRQSPPRARMLTVPKPSRPEPAFRGASPFGGQGEKSFKPRSFSGRSCRQGTPGAMGAMPTVLRGHASVRAWPCPRKAMGMARGVVASHH